MNIESENSGQINTQEKPGMHNLKYEAVAYF